MSNDSYSYVSEMINRQGANALLSATLGFLRSNNISKKVILDSVRGNCCPRKPRASIRQYRRLVRAYEEMGIVMSTWFSSPRFLDEDCKPVVIAVGRSRASLAALVRLSRVNISVAEVATLMHQSPSVEVDSRGNFMALRREFVLPGFEVPRAALVVERYLDTLRRNSSSSKRKTVLLLERNCHVPEVNLRTITPILRDIKGRGSAFINAVNGDIEDKRSRSAKHRAVGEMSVHIFAWTRPSRSRKSKTQSKNEKRL
jgi:hypothetical protein